MIEIKENTDQSELLVEVERLRHSNEKLAESEREKEILFSIGEAIASVRERDELLAVIIDKVQPIFGFNQYSNIAVYNRERNMLAMFFTKTDEREQSESEIPTFMKLFPVEGIFQTIIETNEIVVTDESWKTIPKSALIDEASAQIWRDLDFKYGLSAALRSFGKLIGTFHVHFFEEQTFTEAQLRLFKAISEQIAVAVANILANEEILAREREKAVLLSISEQLAAIRNKHDLFAVIFEKLKPVFHFDDAVFVLYDEKLEHTRHVHATTHADYTENPNYQAIMANEVAVAGTPYEEFAGLEAPQIYTFEYLFEKYPSHIGVKILQDFGLVESVFMPMRYGGRLLGTFEFHSKEKGRFRESQMPLFRNLADQIAVAVSNILANEEILEREREKSALLSISEDIATIRNKDDLFRVVTEKLKPIFGFDDAVVFVSDFEQNHYYALLVNSPQNRLASQFYKPLTTKILPLEGSIEEWIISHDKPFILSSGQFAELFPGAPGVRLMQEVGINDGMFGVMRNGGKIIGSFHLHSERADFFKPGQLAVFQSVTDQLAVAVANILANEEILRFAEERRERAEELARTNEALRNSTLRLTSVENIELFIEGVLTEIIKEAKAKGAAIFQVTPDGEYLRMTHYAEGSGMLDISTDPRLAVWRKTEKPLDVWGSRDLMSGEILWNDYSRGAIAEDWEEAFPFHQMMGHKTVTCLPLLVGGQYTGFLGICFADILKPTGSMLQLCQTLVQHAALALHFTKLADAAKQMAIAREQEKAALLRADELAKSNEALARTSAHLAEQPDLTAFLSQVVIETCNQLNADAGHLIILDEKRRVFQTATLIENGAVATIQPLAEEMPLAEAKFWLVLRETMKPRRFDIEKEADLFWRGSIEYLRAHNLESVIAFPLVAGNKILGVMGIAFRNAEPIGEQQAELINALAHQAALAIQLTRLADEARQTAVAREQEKAAQERAAELSEVNEALTIANEEIREREGEKSILLSISEAITGIREKDDLLRVISEIIKPLFKFDDAVIALIDPAARTHSAFLLHAADDRKNHAAFKQAGSRRYPVQDGIVNLVLESDRPLIFDVTQKAAELPALEYIQFLHRAGINEMAVARLRTAGETIGLLYLQSAERKVFDERRLNLLQSISDQVAAAVANILANEEILTFAEERRRRAEELAKSNEALARTSAHLIEQPDLTAFLSQVVIEATNQLNADGGLLVTFDEKNERLRITTMVENGVVVHERALSSEMPESEVGFFRILRETHKPRYFDLEADGHLFWRGGVDYLRERGQKTTFAFPLYAGERILGVLALSFGRFDPINEQQSELIAALAHQAALAIQLTSLADEARRNARESAVLDERNRIAREIHDTLAQSFTGIVVQLEAGKRILNEAPEETEKHLGRAAALAREGLSEARRSVQALRPLSLEQTDLPTTLEQFLDRMTGGTTIKCRFNLIGTPAAAFAPEINANFLRIGQEAVTNVIRHADARRMNVELRYEMNRIELTIEDDGCGFKAEVVSSGFGLIGMRERARSINAQLCIGSRDSGGRGTRVNVVYQNQPPLLAKTNGEKML